MDETSYSAPVVIRLINERYVPIRVDNDERPDVNRRYNMGGWPTTAFLTPDGEIVHGGTYVPPDAMRSYLPQVAELWSSQRSDLAQRVAELREKENEARAPKSGDLSVQIVDQVGSCARGRCGSQGRRTRSEGRCRRTPPSPTPRGIRWPIASRAMLPMWTPPPMSAAARARSPRTGRPVPHSATTRSRRGRTTR